MTDLSIPLERILDDIASQGLSVCEGFLPSWQIAQLEEETLKFRHANALNPAGIGKGQEHVINTEIRGDFILWLEEPDLTDLQRNYLDTLEELRRACNASLQLGLYEFEGHLAAYPAGSFYKKHLDRFRNSSQRTLTCILYLNPDWQPEDGGELRIYLDDDRTMEVLPLGGTLVSFLSDRFWHEVLPAGRERLSITGWFKTRGNAVV